MDNNEGTIAPSNIVINGQEYSPEEAQDFIETGRKAREYEQKWNVKLDSVWPEYGKTRESLKSLEQERDAARAELDEFKAKQQAQVETPADVQAAKEAARKLGLVLNEDLGKEGYVKTTDLDEWYAKKTQEQEAVKSVLAEADKLASEINATGVPVKFNKKAVLAYASAYGKTDLREAYEEMNAEELAPWKEAQLASKKGSSLRTLGTGGKKAPEDVRVTNDNVRDLLHETLLGTGNQ